MPSHQATSQRQSTNSTMVICAARSSAAPMSFVHSLLLFFVLLLLLEFGVNDRLVLLFLALPCSNKMEKECEGDLG